MKAQLFYSGSPVSHFEALINKFNPSEFSSPLRSTVLLLLYWKNFHQRIERIFRNFNLNFPKSIDVCFEYKVPVQRGRGNSSYTDLMLTSREHVLAIEGKYTEPPYDSVKKWLGNQPSTNKVQVLEGWLDLLEKGTGKRLHIKDVNEITYQVIHRSASACYPKAKQRFVIYQCFDLDESMKIYYKNQLSRLSILLESSNKLKFYLVIHPVIKREAFMQLEALWKSGKRNLEQQVKKGLIEGTMLDFGNPEIFNFRL